VVTCGDRPAFGKHTTGAVTATRGNQNWSTTLSGTDNRYFQVRDWTRQAGRRCNAGEVADADALVESLRCGPPAPMRRGR
jgi:hypothetical protein